jgi:hypothetical protein
MTRRIWIKKVPALHCNFVDAGEAHIVDWGVELNMASLLARCRSFKLNMEK